MGGGVQHGAHVGPQPVGHQLAEVRVQLDQHVVVRGRHHRHVQAHVRRDEELRVPARPSLLAARQQGVQLDQVPLRAPLGRQPGRRGLQRGAQLGDVPRLGPGEAPVHDTGQLAGRDDVRARALPDVEEAVVRQGPHRLAHGVAGDAHELHQLRLGGDARADRPLTGGDLVAQLGDHLIDEGGAPGRGQRHGFLSRRTATGQPIIP